MKPAQMYSNAIFALLVFGLTVSAQVAVYGQCGGENYSGSTQCAAGSTCVYSNPYYSQCLPPSSSSSTLSTTTTASGSASSATLYGQCGGSGYTGPTQCPPGTTCQYNNAYYSQCLYPSSSSSSGSGGSSGNPPPSSSSTSPSSSTGSGSGSNPTYKASMTHYGSGDQNGSPNCNTNTAACGFYTQPGYSAAISQNFYGVGPGQGAGPACGTCWQLTGETDSSGQPLSNAGTTIVVMINNLCPADGNPLCAQNGQSGTNQYGANINFDLCSDSGASGAFFGNDGEGLAVGYATQVSCSEWSGTVQH